MSMLQAAGWGVLGGCSAGLVALAAAIVAAGHMWPWGGNGDGPWPRLCVYIVGVVVGGIVAAAAHSQMTGPWPALLLGVGAPSVITGALRQVEVEERKLEVTSDEAQAGGRDVGAA